MNYNKDNLVVSSTITNLEDSLNDLLDEIYYFNNEITNIYNDLEIDSSPAPSLFEAIDKLKSLNNISDKQYSSMFNGVEHDLMEDEINNNEIKFVALVKPGETIEFTLENGIYLKPYDRFTTGNKNFIIVDWGNGEVTQGNNHFRYTYDKVDDNFIDYNDEYKQTIVTVKPSCYLEDEDTLLATNISFNSNCVNNILGIYNNNVGLNNPYYDNSSISLFSYNSYKNLRYLYANKFKITNSCFNSCYRLKKIKANDIYMMNNTNSTFADCYSLETIDANISSLEPYTSVTRTNMFDGCYNLSYIKSFDLGIVFNEANYGSMFANCFKLVKIPNLIIDCQLLNKDSNSFFYCCMSLENPFQYLKNLNMLKNAYRLFYGCCQIVQAPDVLDLSLATNATELFAYCSRMEIAPKTIYLDNATTFEKGFYCCFNLLKTPNILTAPKVTNVNYLFEKCYLLTSIDCDLNFENVGNNYVQPFNYCYSLREFKCNTVKFGGKNDNTLNTLDTNRYVFQHCNNLKILPKKEFSIRYLETTAVNWVVNLEEYPETLNITGTIWNNIVIKSLADIKKMPKVINVTHATATCSLFQGSVGLKEINDLTININNSANINAMFENCINLETINNLTINAPNATNISYFFKNCRKLKTLNNVVFNLKQDASINMNYIFSECLSLKEIPSLGFEYEEHVGSMTNAFEYSGIEKINFTKPFKRITDGRFAFQYCKWLEEIKFKNNKLDASYNNFLSNNYSLKKINLDMTLNPGMQYFLGNSFYSQLTEVMINFNNVVWDNNAQFDLRNYPIIHKVELLNYANNSNIIMENNLKLKKLKIIFKPGNSANIYIKGTGLDADALNEFFENLPTTTNKTIYIKDTVGASLCDRTIATKKGWVVNSVS